MKLEIRLSDIGPFRGTYSFTLDSARLNIIEAPNAAGKSSLIKALAAVLGLPAKRPLANDVARRLGLIPSSPEELNPLVNVESKQAIIELRENGQSRKLIAALRGYPRVTPPGDDRFLITGLILRESEIVRKLDEGSEDFSWLVDALSLSLNYEKVKHFIEIYLVEARDILQRLLSDQKLITSATQQLEFLRKTRQELEEQRDMLEQQLNKALTEQKEKIKELKELEAQRDDKRKEIQEYEHVIRRLESEKQRYEVTLKSISSELAQLQSQLDRIQGQLENLPTDDVIREKEKEAREIREKLIPNLREAIGKLKYQVALLEQAEKWIAPGSVSVPCPLCEIVGANPRGMLPAANFNSALLKARDALRDAEARLAKALHKAGELEAFGLDVERRRNELLKQRKEIKPRLEKLKQDLLEAKNDYDPIVQDLENRRRQVLEKRMALNEIISRLQQLQEKYGGPSGQLITEIKRIDTEIGRLEDKIAELDSQILAKATTVIRGKMIKLEEAIRLYESWVHVLVQASLYVDEAILQQRRGALQLFNKEVTRLLKEMNFEGLRVWIDESSYKLRVQRASSYGYVDQPIASLSTAERHALAAVLTLAAKEAYAKDIPYFLIDEVLLDFDKQRLAALTKYLNEAALNKGHLVVVSRLGGEKLNIQSAESL